MNLTESIFLVKGTVKFGGKVVPFSKEVKASKKESAISKVQSLFGSYYKTKRHLVKISSIEEVHGKAQA